MKRNKKTGLGKKLVLLLLAALTALHTAGTAFAGSENKTAPSAPISGPLAVTVETAEIQTYLEGKSYPKALLKTIRDAIVNGTATDISIYDYSVPTSEVSDLLNAVREAYPLEYAAQGVSRYGWSSIGGAIYTLTLYENTNFNDGLTAAQRCTKLHQIMDPVVSNAQGMSNYEKIIYIHDWLGYRRLSGIRGRVQALHEYAGHSVRGDFQRRHESRLELRQARRRMVSR